jgi:hypothetical protein
MDVVVVFFDPGRDEETSLSNIHHAVLARDVLSAWRFGA